MKRYQQGFTLIEMMVVVVIVGILAALAWPMYQEQNLKKRRSDGIAGLTMAARVMERCYSNNGSYATCALSPGDQISPKEFYSIAITAQAVESYTLTGTDNFTGDDNCTSLILNNLGQKLHSTNTGVDARFCWGGS